MRITVGPAHRLPATLFESAHTHAAFALTRFSSHIRRVTIRVADANGPRKGVDQVCTVAIRLARPGAEIIVVDADADPFAALARATTRAARTVARRLDRRP